MQNNYGKTFLILLVQVFGFGCIYPAEIETALLHMDGTPLEQIERSQPFLFQVNVDVSESFSVPKLAMPPQARYQLVSTNIITKGGTARARYQFQVYIDALGTYRVGPASLKTARGELVSDYEYVEVVDQSVRSNPNLNDAPTQSHEGPFARLFVEKSEYFVGERVEARVRFYYKESFLECEALHEPDYDKATGIVVSKGRGPLVGSEKIEGVSYRFYEWTFYFYFNKTGKHLLQPYRIDYSVGNMNSFFAFAGLSKRTNKSTYSNDVRLEVHDLPHSSVKAEAVGSFSSYSARLSPAIVHQGQATTLRLELVGDPGDISDMPLGGIDDSFKLYPSTKTLEKRSGKTVHVFEYVVQPKALGEYIIPAQQFTFFDPQTRSYKTLSTHELSLSVIESQQSTKTTEVAQKKVDAPYTIALHNNGKSDSFNPIDWKLFFILLGLFGAGALFLTGLRAQLYTFALLKRMAGRYHARSKARHEIKRLYVDKRYDRLHAVVYEYASDIAKLSGVRDESLLKKAGMNMPIRLQEQYKTFLQQLEHVTFSKGASDTMLSAQDVIAWLPAIEKGVRRGSK